MIAMAENYDATKKLMTVRQVMEEIGALAPATISRMIRQKKLKAVKLTVGWLVYRDSVREFLDSEAHKNKGVGFPRGQARAAKKKSLTKAKQSRR